MRSIFLSLLVFCFQLVSAQSNIDVLHYKFNIGLNDANDTIYGIAEITVLVPRPGDISLDLVGLDVKGKGMKIDSVLVNRTGKFSMIAGADTQISFFKHANNKLSVITRIDRVDDPSVFKMRDTIKYRVHYHGIPSDGLIISKTKYGHRSFFADNWPNRGHNWIPCHDDPADKATTEFVVTAPEHYQVVANGVQIEETSLGNGFRLTHWKEDTPIPPKVMVIGVADFAVNLAGVVNGNIPVYSWVYPENKDKGFYDYEIAKDILPFFINNVGLYGYKKLANVQSKTRFGGLENANTIFYSEGSVSGTRRSEGTIAHEIAHQWFGNMATEKSFGHLWLSEGFATYFTILYFENKYGKDTATKMLLEDRAQVIKFSKESNRAIVDTGETDYMKLLNANSYQKGGWVLHMLRKELGDSTFWRSVRKYYATYAGGVADTRDLQKIFEHVSGKDLKTFFDQWLYAAGQPDLDISWKYDATAKIIHLEVKQVQAKSFQFPLTLNVIIGSNNKKEKIFIDKVSASFKIKTNQKPTSISVDPDTEMLMSSSIKEK